MRVNREVVKVFEKTLLMYIFAETPLHPGSGTTTKGGVDLPIQRERHTGFPIIQGSSLKGVLKRSAEKEEDEGLINATFGTEEEIGGVSITDARILAFPVRTLKGVFGWITCPLILDRYKRDLKLAGENPNWSPSQIEIKDEEAIVHSDSNIKSELEGKKYVFVEDLQLEAKEKDELLEEIASKIAEGFLDNNAYSGIKWKLQKDLMIVSNDVFRDLVSLTTEVVTRIKIEPEKGVVEGGGLWTEEYLPTDTLMYSLILIPKRKKSAEVAECIQKFSGKILQIGGDETIGKGFARIKIVGGSGSAKES